MPIEIAPNRIDLVQLDGGYCPDTPESAIPLNASPDMSNLLLEHGGMTPEVRKGYERLTAGRASSLTAHSVRSLAYYETIKDGYRSRLLMAVMSDGTSSANNVQIWAYDLLNDTFERVDDSGRVWTNPDAPHWSVVVPGPEGSGGSATFYGGVRGDAIYSYHAVTGWDADPTKNHDLMTWLDNVNDAVDTSEYVARDYAFRQGRRVKYEDEEYATTRSIRYDKWETDQVYRQGDLVSRRHTWASVSGYWKSFECQRQHLSATNNAPGTSTATHTYWKKVRLPDPLNEDLELNDGWAYAGNGVQSSVGVFYGDRLMVRRDNESERSMVQYTAPLDTSAIDKKGDDPKKIADLIFNPRDWAEVDDINGEGGGHFYVSPGRGDAIRDMYPMGNYLVIAKRWSSHVLSGRSEQTWNQRPLGNLGVVALNNLVELDGLVYGLSHTGTLWMTDGTSQREVAGAENAREFIKERIDRLLQVTPEDDDEKWMPKVWAYDRRIWISLPDAYAAGTPDDITLVYDPISEGGSWWKLSLPVLSATTGAADRSMRMWFGTPKRSGSATLFQYQDDPGDLGFVDDDPLGGASTLTTAIPWYYKTAWMQFGAVQQDRRIRRMWALVKTAVSVTLTGYRNFLSSSAYSVTRSADSGGTSFVEGKHMADSHAVALKVAGTAATGGPALVGVGADTQPRRTRFHRGA